MEDVDSPQTTAWVKAEGDLTRSYLDAIPQRDAIRTEYRKLLDYEKVSAPFHQGPWWFFTRNTGLQNQNVLYVRRGENGTPRVLLDPNTLAADGTVALAGYDLHARRQADGVLDAVVGRGLADVARQGRRDRHRSARRAAMEQVLRARPGRATAASTTRPTTRRRAATRR